MKLYDEKQNSSRLFDSEDHHDAEATPKVVKPSFLPRILTKEGMREFRKTEEFKMLKYYFAPNMDDKYYFFYTSLLILFIAVLMVLF